LICTNRFTTYETTEEHLLPFLLKEKAGRETITKKAKNLISLKMMAFKELAEGIEVLIEQMGDLDKSRATNKSKVKTSRPKRKNL